MESMGIASDKSNREVVGEIDVLSENTERLQKVYESLSIRLGGLINHNKITAVPDECSSKEPAQLCELAEKIRVNKQKIGYVVDGIDSLLRKLEI